MQDANVWMVIVTGVFGLLGAGGGVVAILKARRDNRAADRKDAIEEAFRLIDKLDADVKKAELKADEAGRKERECTVRLERAEGRIDMLEEALTRNNIPFRPWVRRPDTPQPGRSPPGNEPGGKGGADG